MTQIGLLSDTHGWLDPQVFTYFAGCDEIWHAGDFGSHELADQLEAFKPLRGVYGNIDDGNMHRRFPEQLSFTCENLKVCMQHIGGYPGRYAPRVKPWLQQEKPGLFISGHSHILKVQMDTSLQCLHINPGAAGKHGWHTMRTMVRFTVDCGKIKDLEVIELGKRGKL
jgi:putative phosphoesterase